MKSTSTEQVYESRLLYEHPYIVISGKTDENTLLRIKQKNPGIDISERRDIYDIGAGAFDIKMDHVFEVIFDADNIENCLEVPVAVKGVFALGYKSIDEIPSTWSVCVLLEFPGEIPSILSGLQRGRRFYLSSRKMWNDLIALYR